MADITYEETMQLLQEPWREGRLTRDFSYEGVHPEGERVLWKLYHNDPRYISVRLLDEFEAPIVEFTEVPDLVKGAQELVDRWANGTPCSERML